MEINYCIYYILQIKFEVCITKYTSMTRKIQHEKDISYCDFITFATIGVCNSGTKLVAT